MTQEKNTGHELDLQSGKEFVLSFADLLFTVRYLTPADRKTAEKISRIPGTNPKKPKYDMEKQGTELVFASMKGWTHADGGKLLHPGGKEIEVNRENVELFILNYPGLGAHIIRHVSNANQMYRTLTEEDVKN